MFKLIFIHTTPPEVYFFDQVLVTIGCKESNADIIIPEEKIASVHVTIEEKNGQFIVVNAANDPFVSLNNFPFGKRYLQQGDILQIGKTSLRFEAESFATAEEQSKANSIENLPFNTSEELEEKVEKRLEEQRELWREELAIQEQEAANKNLYPSSALPGDSEEESSYFEPVEEEAEPPEEPSAEQPPSYDEIEELLRQVENLEEKESEEKQFSVEETEDLENEEEFVTQTSRFSPLEGEKVVKFEEEFEGEAKEEKEKTGWIRLPSFLQRSYSWIVIILLATFLLLAGAWAFKNWYNGLLDQVKVEELKASETAADVAMALMYAKIHKIQPQNHNWSDPHFLRNNLLSILPSYTSDKMGWGAYESEQSPYSLRIYTSSNLSRFLVIIQPKPSFRQDFIPRAAIAVDSEEMLLRKTVQFKELNRLLLDPDLFTVGKEEQISELLRQFEIVPLFRLAETSKEKHHYLPPKALALLRPGSENKVYNAPRYFLFGEALIEKALALFPSENNSSSELQDSEAEVLTPLPDMVFYSSHGMAQARKNQEILQKLNPEGQIFTAYLRFNEGQLSGSHLLIGDRSKQEAVPETALVAALAPNETEVKVKSPSHSPAPLSEVIREARALVEEGRSSLKIQVEAITRALKEYVQMDEWEKELLEEKQIYINNIFDNWSLSTAYYEQEILILFYDYLASFGQEGTESLLIAAEEAGLTSWVHHAIDISAQVNALARLELSSFNSG